MGRTCSTFGQKKNIYTKRWLGNLKKLDNLEDVSVDWKVS